MTRAQLFALLIMLAGMACMIISIQVGSANLPPWFIVMRTPVIIGGFAASGYLMFGSRTQRRK